MDVNDILDSIIKQKNKLDENKTINNNRVIHFPPTTDDLPHALEVLRKYDETSYDNLNKILEKASTTEIKTPMVIQTMDMIDKKKI